MHLFDQVHEINRTQRGKKKSCLHRSTYQHLKAASSFDLYMSLLQREKLASILIDPCIHEITWVHIATSKNALKLWKVFAENSMPFLFAAWTIRFIKNKNKKERLLVPVESNYILIKYTLLLLVSLKDLFRGFIFKYCLDYMEC